MRKLFVFVFVIVLILVSFFGVTILDGQVTAAQLGSTMWGIKQCLNAKPGTQIFTNGQGQYVFAWTAAENWMFTAINASTSKEGTGLFQMLKSGNVVNAKTMSGLADFLRNQGWKIVDASSLDPKVISAYTAAARVLASLNGLSTFMVIFPVFDGQPLQVIPVYGSAQ